MVRCCGERPRPRGPTALRQPLIVAHKPSSTATNVKLRFIHDCRYVNRHLEHFPFSMERLKDFTKQLCHLDRLFAIDIASAYHHVMIAPRFRTLLGFTFEGEDYVYDTLPFGLSFSWRFSRIASSLVLDRSQ